MRILHVAIKHTLKLRLYPSPTGLQRGSYKNTAVSTQLELDSRITPLNDRKRHVLYRPLTARKQIAQQKALFGRIVF